MSEQNAVCVWQQIDTAPKDGSRILLAKIVGNPAHDTALWWVVLGSWSEKWNKWWDGIEPCGLAGPTHWLPVDAYGVVPMARDHAALQEGGDVSRVPHYAHRRPARA